MFWRRTGISADFSTMRSAIKRSGRFSGRPLCDPTQWSASPFCDSSPRTEVSLDRRKRPLRLCDSGLAVDWSAGGERSGSRSQSRLHRPYRCRRHRGFCQASAKEQLGKVYEQCSKRRRAMTPWDLPKCARTPFLLQHLTELAVSRHKQIPVAAPQPDQSSVQYQLRIGPCIAKSILDFSFENGPAKRTDTAEDFRVSQAHRKRELTAEGLASDGSEFGTTL